jgi:hypothetical protein
LIKKNRDFLLKNKKNRDFYHNSLLAQNQKGAFRPPLHFHLREYALPYARTYVLTHSLTHSNSQITTHMARPKILIDEAKVEELAEIGATNDEIAHFVGCSVATLKERFQPILDKGRSGGKTRLRMLQWQSAKSGNVVMQIWLGKQYLGQSDKAETRTTNEPTLDAKDIIERAARALAGASHAPGIDGTSSLPKAGEPNLP